MNTPNTGTSQKVRLGVFIAAVALLAGGGWYTRQHFVGDSVPLGVELDVGNAVRGGMRFGGPRGPGRNSPLNVDVTQMPDGIRPLPAGQFAGKAGEFSVMLPAKPAINQIRVLFTGADWASPEQRRILDARRELIANPTLAEKIKLTPQQREKLTQIPIDRARTLTLDRPQREQLLNLWLAIDAATDPAAKEQAGNQFINTLRQMGPGALDASRQQTAQRVEQIKSILTPEQLKLYLGQ